MGAKAAQPALPQVTSVANSPQMLRIGSASFDPATRRLKQDDREVRLDPKEVEVLLELAGSAPAMVSREHLLSRVWAGTSVVDNALDQVIARLRRALGDDARQPSCIETLPRRGYRLMVPVVRTAREGDTSVRSESGLPSVSFLPLATIGDESVLVEYARIASEDISNRLAESNSARVIAHEAAGSGHPLPKFLAQGTLRRAGEQIRTSVQLVRTEGGDVLWSESFDEPLESATSGRFAHAPFVARTIEGIVRSAHQADTVSTRSEEARRHYYQGLRELDALASDVGNWFVAADYFERAVSHDPELKDALEQLAFAYGRRLGAQLRVDRALPRAHEVLSKLLRIDPNATLTLGFVNHSLDLDYASAMANIEHARRHGFADVALVEFHKALVFYKQGRFDDAIARMQGAIRAGLGSGDASARYLLTEMLAVSGRFGEAIAAIDGSLQSGVPLWSRGHLLRIRIGHYMGNREEAKRDLAEAWSLFGQSDRSAFPGVLGALDQPELARTILRENDLAWHEGRLHQSAYSFGGHYYLGEFDQAFVWLDRAIENREWWLLPFIRSKFFYADIRNHPRFQRAMRRLAEIEAIGSPTRSVATGAPAA